MDKQLKNKDGIVIRAGQLWTAGEDRPEVKTLRVVGFDTRASEGNRPYVVMLRNEKNYDAYRPGAVGIHELIRSHDGADLEQARADGWQVWVAGMEKPSTRNMTYSFGWDWDAKEWVQEASRIEDWDQNTYRFKTKTEVLPAKELKPQKPPFKLFEIEWSHYWPILSGAAEVRSAISAQIGRTAGGYRIFGFTDASSLFVALEQNADTASYEKQPCNHTGNRKYAIGRLEE